MKIIIAGGSGFLGTALEKSFQDKGNEVIILTRNPRRKNEVYWNAQTLDKWAETLEGADVLINMTGKSVDCRYNEANKKEILTSRVESTKILGKAIETTKNPPKTWLNASSATIYIHAETQLMNETDGILGDDFSVNICKAWEKAFFEKSLPNVRKIALRTPIVLGNGGGAFPKMKRITQVGLGGKQGRGNQLMSWIHIQDFCRAVEYVIEHEEINGEINMTAPNPIKNADFMKTLRQVIGMPFGLNAPVFLLEFASIFMQTEAELLLKSRNVFPKKLIDNGFVFQFPEAKETFEDLIKK